MKCAATGALALALACLASGQEFADSPRFMPVDVVLDSAEPVAAWQFELTGRQGAIKVVGVESGDSAAFEDPPYYDREATQAGEVERLVVADYSLADADMLPVGRTRIATVHVMVVGEPDLELTLVTAKTADGRSVDASICAVLATDDRWRNRWTEKPAA